MELQRLMTKVEESNKVEMSLNKDKTECMAVATGCVNRFDILASNKPMKQMQTYINLWSILTEDGQV